MTMVIPSPGQVLHWLGGQIDIHVEIDTGLAGASFGLWDAAEWDVDDWGSYDPAWADITDYVEDISIDTGVQRWGERFDVGTMTIVLDNTDGRFTPDSGVMPFHLPFRPGRRIRTVAIPDPDDPLGKEPQFTGFIDSIDPVFDEGGMWITATLNCLDFMAAWSNHDPPALDTPTGVQDTDERVEAALDRMGWSASLRDIQTGSHTMQSSHLAQSTLEECAAAADAEGGAFFCGKDGSAVFKARDWLSTDARSVGVQGYLGYDTVPEGANTAHFTNPQPTWEIARIINLVQFARVGSTMQEAEDTESQSLYDVRSYQRTDLQNNDDAEVLFLAERYLDQSKDLKMRVNSITITAVEDPDNEDLNRLMWDSQFGDLISIRIATPYGWQIDKLVKIMGISHHITAEDWEVTFFLDDVFIFTGGSEMAVSITFEGGGERSTREGGSEMTLAVEMEGQGTASSKSGGSEMEIEIGFEGVGTIDRIELMALLDPVAWWRFNSAAETPDFGEDLSGNGHDLTYSGIPVPSAQGVSSGGPIAGTDGYMPFDGTNDYATVADEGDLELRQDMSIEFWARPHDASGGAQCIISVRGSDATHPVLYEVFYWPDLDLFMFYPTATAGSGFHIGNPSTRLHNVWHHVVVTIDWSGSNRIICRYINGTPYGSGTSFAYQPGVATREVRIGRRGIFDDLYFDGDISELAIFDRVLTASEVRYLYESTYLGA